MTTTMTTFTCATTYLILSYLCLTLRAAIHLPVLINVARIVHFVANRTYPYCHHVSSFTVVFFSIRAAPMGRSSTPMYFFTATFLNPVM